MRTLLIPPLEKRHWLVLRETRSLYITEVAKEGRTAAINFSQPSQKPKLLDAIHAEVDMLRPLPRA